MPSRPQLHRRAFLGGSLATGLIGLASGRTAHAQTDATSARGCIMLTLRGGPSHVDTFDPKPGAADSRFGTRRTKVAGVRFSEHLPLLAGKLGSFTLIRSMSGVERDHQRASHVLHTSHAPQGGIGHPSFGAVVAKHHGHGALPPYVVIGGPAPSPGVLGATFTAFEVRNPTRPVPHLRSPRFVSTRRFERRMEQWREREADFLGRHAAAADDLLERRAVLEHAIAMTNSDAIVAFDLEQEPKRIRERYGDTVVGQGLLMARRLVAAGVPFVEVAMPGWDTHVDNFSTTQRLSRELDTALGNLFADMASTGLLDEILVLALGEFGRTPTINAKGGRDHHATAFSAIVAGGGVPGGQVLGQTDSIGREPIADPVTVPDLLRTVAVRLGVDPDEERVSRSGRPFTTIDGGRVIGALG